MNRNAANLLGVLSAVPLAYMLFLVGSTMNQDLVQTAVKTLFPFGIAVLLTFWGVLLIFAVFLIRSPKFPIPEKILWFGVLILFSFISLPVFWWLHLRQPPSNGQTNF